MKIGCIIPDRRDRPKFLEHCLFMINRQSRMPDKILVMNDKPLNNKPDLTYRIRSGFDQLKDECDLIFVIENDDWYSENYIEIMSNKWLELGRPELFGIAQTTYYHIQKREHKTWQHNHSSLFCTVISSKAEINWPKDTEVFLDMHLWKTVKNKYIWIPKELIVIGIKHGEGLCGGKGHTTLKYDHVDPYMTLLSRLVDSESLEFYKNYFTDHS